MLPQRTFRPLVGLLAAASLISSAAWAAPVKIRSVTLARRHPATPSDQTRTFASRDLTFHAVVSLDRPSSGDKVKAVWILADAGGVRNYRFAEKTLGTRHMDTLHFATTMRRPWPRGKYRLDVYMNGKRARQEYFEVR